MLIGRIQSGKIKVGERVQAVDANGQNVETGKIIKIIKKFGMAHVELEQGFAGDIVSIAGLANGTVNHTINPPGKFQVIPSVPIDMPSLTVMVPNIWGIAPAV
jgi:GTP-binding protein